MFRTEGCKVFEKVGGCLRDDAFVFLLWLGLCACAPIALAQTPGTFTPTGLMTTPRDEHTATLLMNGKVLIAGGENSSSGSLASAELYDPTTGTFSATGALSFGRRLHSATLLADGEVLIAGGWASGQALTSAELYDSSTGTFTATGNMLTGGAGAATVLANGKVLIAHDPVLSKDPAGAEIYDPATGIFTATGDQQLNPNDTSQAAALLPDGRVVLVACCTQIQLYDPVSGKFSFSTNTTLLQDFAQNFWFTMTLLMNGKLLLSGGCFCEGNQGDPVSASAGLYDPSTGTSVIARNITTPRAGHSATLLPDGTILIAGGLRSTNTSNDVNATAELYDPATATFSRTGDMTTARLLQTATLLFNGKVLITGGAGTTTSADLYTPAVLVPAPALFFLSGDGRGQGAIWHAQTGQIASADSPAFAGEYLSMYTTSLPDGGVIPPQVSVGGQLAEVPYFGASGYPGYSQVNFRMPSGVAPGLAVPVRLTYLGRLSNQVTIGVQ